MPRARVLPKQGISALTDAFAKSQLAGAVDQGRRDANVYPWADGALIKDVAIAGTGVKVIQHGLGRVPQGWILLRAVSASSLFMSTTASEQPTTTTITLRNPWAAAGTFDIWVF